MSPTRCPLCDAPTARVARVHWDDQPKDDVDHAIHCPTCGKLVWSAVTDAVLGLADPEERARVAAQLVTRRRAGFTGAIRLRPQDFVAPPEG